MTTTMPEYTGTQDGEVVELSVFEAHEMRINSPHIPQADQLVYCICGEAWRIPWFDRGDPELTLTERVTVAYRQHLKDTP